MQRLMQLTLALALTALLSIPATAAEFSAAATTNATYELDGLTTQPWWLNAQGTGGDFDEFSVLDFSSADFGLGADVASIQGATFSILEDAAGFAAAGNVELLLLSDTSFDLRDDAGPAGSIVFQPGDAPAGIGDQFGSTLSLGTFAYDPVNGDNFQYDWSLTLDAPAEAAMIDALNGGQTLRLGLVAADASVIATLDGATGFDYENSSLAGPTLMIDATLVPEPASLAMLGLGGLAMLRRRR